MEAISTKNGGQSSGEDSPLTLVVALTVLLRLLAGGFEAVRQAVPLERFAGERGSRGQGSGGCGAWAELHDALRAAQERVEDVGPRSSSALERSEDEVLGALLRGEALHAADVALDEVAARLELSGDADLRQIAEVAQRSARAFAPDGAMVVAAWLEVYRALHGCPGEGREVRAQGLYARCPACGAEFGPVTERWRVPPHAPVQTDRPTEPPPTPRLVPGLVVELPALLAGAEGERVLQAVAAELHGVLACQSEVVKRGRGLV
ncbi:MAG TPA: hypothetical protein VLS89_08575, partial [Candidatus Nanopelagicales bacterium]|nr:hypothetical protein [Candidatus Nanopelagicales bacterium]